MCNITLAKTAGFCFGVDRAIKLIEKLLKKNKKVKGHLSWKDLSNLLLNKTNRINMIPTAV